MIVSEMSHNFSAIESSKPYLSVVDRYFVRRFKTDVNEKQGEDLCILEHSNKLCIVTLAKSHPIIREKLHIKNVDFQIDEKSNRLDNKVSGKAKRGAQSIGEKSPLCHIECDDDRVFTVYGCIRGNLVEVNERLLTEPQLLTTKPDSEGYIAVLLTRHNEHDREMNKLLDEQRYNTLRSTSSAISSHSALFGENIEQEVKQEEQQ